MGTMTAADWMTDFAEALAVGARIGDRVVIMATSTGGAARTPASGPRRARTSALPAGARAVSLVGDFNGWDAAATPMARTGAGAEWSAQLPLTPGRHVYAFVIDGTRWLVDPMAPQVPDADLGPANAVIVEGAF